MSDTGCPYIYVVFKNSSMNDNKIDIVVTSRAKAWNLGSGPGRDGNRQVQVWRNGKRIYNGWLSDMPSDFADRS